MADLTECGCPDPGPHTARCLAPLLSGIAVRGGDPSCAHTWIQVRSSGWLLKAVCLCKAVKRFLVEDFNQEIVAGRMTCLPRRS